MKKALLLFIIMFSLNVMMAQQRATLPPGLERRAMISNFERPHLINPDLPVFKVPNALTTHLKGGLDIEENIIGTTYYDLQTNALLQNRFHCYEDGFIGATWTMGMNATAFPDRGTGYNYFDGVSWQPNPSQRIETFRAGWPSYAPLGQTGEVVVSHDFTNYVLYFMNRPVKGTGTWNQAQFTYTTGPTTLTWPRMTTSGEDNNTIHLLASTFGEYQGQTVGMVYSRSLDGGASWDIQNQVIDGTGSDYYSEINADQYVWANPVGNTIAFLVASAWHDLFMMKSEDNGDSWEKTVIWEHPYPFFEWETTITDTIFCVDNSAAIALDSDGKAHVTFGISRVIHAVVGTTYNYFPYVDGIGYWNEDMPTFSNDLSALAPPQYGYPSSEMIEDYNYIGYTQDVDGDGEITFISTSTGFPMAYRELGVSTMPAIAAGPDGWVAVIYASTTETYDNSLWNYKKLWMRIKDSDGVWGNFEHITQDIFHIFDESIYPVAYPVWVNYLHILYNNDASPGTALDGDHDYVENRITYMQVQILPIGIDDPQPGSSEALSLVIYPNPAKDQVRLSYTLETASHVAFTVSDVSGRIIYSKMLGWRDRGDYTQILSLGHLKAGIYFISLGTDNNKLTKKLLVK